MCRCAHASRALQVSATRRRRVSCAFEVETISVKMWSMSSGGRRNASSSLSGSLFRATSEKLHQGQTQVVFDDLMEI